MSRPSVSVGLPIFNGRRFVRQAVESILCQTHDDLELIISDNASTDGSGEICQDYARLDRRVRYYRCDENRGGTWNFRRVADLARGTFFKWMAHDDVCHADFISACMRRLAERPQAVACVTGCLDIDEQGQVVRPRHFDLDVENPRPSVRFRDLICVNHACLEIFALMRLDVLRRCRPMGVYVGSDRALLAELALRGPWVREPRPLLLHREHPQRSTRATPDFRDRLAWFDPARAGRMSFPHWRLLREYLRLPARAVDSWRERLACQLQVLRFVRWARALLRSDLTDGFRWWRAQRAIRRQAMVQQRRMQLVRRG